MYPNGKESVITVDPERQFGHPVINHTNIYPETVYHLYQAGKTIPFISFSYQLTDKEVNDAIAYCQAA